MKPAPFTYHRPATREEIDALLAELGTDAKLLAGGQSLIPILNMRLAQPAHLIDINHLRDEPSGAEVRDGNVCFGPLVRQNAAERSSQVADLAPLLADTMEYVAHPAIRNRGTIVGSIAHADPAAELPSVLTVLNGEVIARSASGTRAIPASDFFAGPLENSLAEDEWACEVRFPGRNGQGHAFAEFARRSGDYALCGVAVTATPVEGDRAVIAFTYLGMGDIPGRFELKPMSHSEVDHPTLEEAIGELVAENLDPHDDIHASTEYRSFLARRLGRRAARRAWDRISR